MAATIPCPSCNTPVPFDPMLLLKGDPIVCPSCNIHLRLPSDSTDQVKETLSTFENIKASATKPKKS